jgi:hypothetical protein
MKVKIEVNHVWTVGRGYVPEYEIYCVKNKNTVAKETFIGRGATFEEAIKEFQKDVTRGADRLN